MAALDSFERASVWGDMMRRLDALGGGAFGGVTKVNLRAAVDAADAWADANAAGFNAAIPQPARGALTAKQKAILLMLVIAKRTELT